MDILVVEDDFYVARVLKNILSYEGYEVGVANNAGEALERLLKKDIPKLIILDLMMPEVDGFSFYFQMRDLPGCTDIPVIILTAISKLEEKRYAYDLGVVAYLTKPFNPVELIKLVRKFLASGTAGDE